MTHHVQEFVKGAGGHGTILISLGTHAVMSRLLGRVHARLKLPQGRSHCTFRHAGGCVSCLCTAECCVRVSHHQPESPSWKDHVRAAAYNVAQMPCSGCQCCRPKRDPGCGRSHGPFAAEGHLEDGRQGGGSSWRALSTESDRQHQGTPSDKVYSLQTPPWRLTQSTGDGSAGHSIK